MFSRVDPHSNILRTTIAASAVGMGGADSVTVLPFDTALGSADAFARRIARNTQTLLLEEAGLAHVADPGAGSGAVEELTRSLAETAWDRFRAVEKQGGLFAAVRSGSLQESIAEIRERRLDQVQHDKIRIVGANAFPDPSAAKAHGKTPKVEGIRSPPIPDVKAEPLRFVRISEPFET
jgi:methylmalonyl-CoA mutase